MGEVGGHQHRVSGWEGAGLAVAHAGVDQVGAFTCAATVTADGNIEGWRGEERKDGAMSEGEGNQVLNVCEYLGCNIVKSIMIH